jgi:RHS repeat-associated protein
MRRRLRKEYVWRNSAWVQSEEIRYVYDANLVVQERHFNPQVSTQTPFNSITYTRGRDLSGTLEGAGGIGGLVARTDNALLAIGDPSAHVSYHADGSGNVTALFNDKQLVVARYLYDPYGNVLSAVGPLADGNLYRFSSKEAHVASDLYYYGYRFYAPNIQRWVNHDPIGQFSQANLYQFVNNSPVTLLDELGLAPVTSQWSTSLDELTLSAAVFDVPVRPPGPVGPGNDPVGVPIPPPGTRGCSGPRDVGNTVTWAYTVCCPGRKKQTCWDTYTCVKQTWPRAGGGPGIAFYIWELTATRCGPCQ